MTVLALDVGDRRIGVAVSDPTNLVVRPLTILARRSNRLDGEAIRQLADETSANTVVVGLPLNADGTPSPQSEKIRAFTRFLRRFLAIPVETWDEHGSTREAQAEMIDMGVSRAKRKAMLDAAAAAVILDEWLLSRRQRTGDESLRGHGDDGEAPSSHLSILSPE